MNKDQTRSIRLNTLLKLADRMTYDQLYAKCMTWGVTKPTAIGYLNSVNALMNKMGKTMRYD